MVLGCAGSGARWCGLRRSVLWATALGVVPACVHCCALLARARALPAASSMQPNPMLCPTPQLNPMLCPSLPPLHPRSSPPCRWRRL